MKVAGNTVVATDGEVPAGMLTFTREEERMIIETVDCGADEWVADGLIRTALNYGMNHGVTHADFAPAVDAKLLTRLYGDTFSRGVSDVSFFFQTCKKCGNFLGK